ncbi:hypothetical protein SGPA1_70020 [Streptomyces misionensis JCM 4497]
MAVRDEVDSADGRTGSVTRAAGRAVGADRGRRAAVPGVAGLGRLPGRAPAARGRHGAVGAGGAAAAGRRGVLRDGRLDLVDERGGAFRLATEGAVGAGDPGVHGGGVRVLRRGRGGRTVGVGRAAQPGGHRPGHGRPLLHPGRLLAPAAGRRPPDHRPFASHDADVVAGRQAPGNEGWVSFTVTGLRTWGTLAPA